MEDVGREQASWPGGWWWWNTGENHCHCIVMCELLCTFFERPSDDEEEEEDDVMRLPSFVVSVVGRWSFGGTYRDRQAGGEIGMGITYGAARAAAAAATTTVQNFTL